MQRNYNGGGCKLAEIQKYSLIDELKKADETLQGSPSLLGMTSLLKGRAFAR